MILDDWEKKHILELLSSFFSKKDLKKIEGLDDDVILLFEELHDQVYWDAIRETNSIANEIRDLCGHKYEVFNEHKLQCSKCKHMVSAVV